MKIAKYCCFVSGTTLLLAALFLVLYNVFVDRQGGEQAEAILSSLQDIIPDFEPETTAVLTAEQNDLFEEYAQASAETETETVIVGDNAYIGYLSIPEIGIELPVLAEWSYPNLKIAPCRYSGDLDSNSLVIAAHNYSSHFGSIGRLSTGSELIFTDVRGKQHCFCVTEIEQLPGTAIEEMQHGSADYWDLTLFTCSLDGRSRVTVRAERVASYQ